MAGIEKIVNEILADAKSRADEILDQARKAADEELAKAEQEQREKTEAADSRSERAAADYADRIRSQCEQENKRAHLAAKQEIIEDVLTKAREHLEKQDAGAYFDMLKKLLGSTVQAEAGEIAFSAADLARLPDGFAAEADAIAKAAGGSLALAAEPVKIDSGYVLRYGQIEVNCSLAALFAEKRDSLQDAVCRILW